MSDGDVHYENARQITLKDFDETHRRTKLSAGDILFTNSGTIGRMAIAKKLPETKKTTFQKSVAILKPNPEVSKTHYLYCLLKSNLQEIKELAGGTSQSNLLLGDLRGYEIQYPNYQLVCEFDNLIAPIFKNIHLKLEQNKKLYKLKELLLSSMASKQLEAVS